MHSPFLAELPPRLVGRMAITHAKVVPMDAERVLADQTILVEDGRIRGMGPSSAVSIEHATEIDASGLYVLPGLADMHIHYSDAAVAGLLLANGVTRVRNMWGSPTQLALNKKVSQGAIPGPWVASTSPIVDGLGTHGQAAWPGSMVLSDPLLADGLVQRFVRRGYQQVKGYQWLAPNVLRALGEAARRHNVRLVGHCPEGISFEEAIDAGMSCFEHLTGVGTGHLAAGYTMPALRDPISRRGSPETLRLVAHHLDPQAIRRMAERMAHDQVWTCPTLVVWQKQVQLPEEALSDPALGFETPGTARGWAGGLHARHAQLSIPVAEWVALARERDAALAGVVRVLHEAGAPLLLGTDAPNPFVVAGVALHQELDNLVSAGLSPFAAVRAGTADAARFMGELDEWGTIEVGKRAELLLASDNPLQSVHTLRAPAALLVNGWYLDRATLDRMLEARVQHVTAPPEEIPPRPSISASAPASAQVGFERAYIERTGGVPTGRLHSRSFELDDGRRLIEEQHIGRVGAAWQERGVRLWLGAGGSLDRGEAVATSWLGTERVTVEQSVSGYRADIETLDGVHCEAEIESGFLTPSERLSPTVLAEVLGEVRAAPVHLLSVEDDALLEITATVTATDNGEFQVDLERPGTVTSQRYELAADGGLQRLSASVWFQSYELERE